MAETAEAPLLTFTGERVVPGQVEPDLWNEHVARYHFAALFAAGKTVLDVGCGTGYGAALLASTAAKTSACDISEEAIAYAAATNHSKVRFTVAAANALPARSGSLGLVTAFEVIEHITDWRGLIQEAARVLTANGVFLVSTPNKDYYGKAREEVGANPFHEHEFELEEFRFYLERSFAYVQVLGQNHQQSIVFGSQNETTNAKAFLPGLKDLKNAHFFLAVCSQQPIEIPSFAFIASSGNLLQDRERHIALLKAEVEEIGTNRAELLTAHRRLNSELEEHNDWARRLDRELEVSTSEVWRRDIRIGQLQADLAALQNAVIGLSNELGAVRQSFWLKLGRALDLGPWTDGRLHIRRLFRAAKASATRGWVTIRPSFDPLLHFFMAGYALILLTIAAGVFAAEDLCFRLFGRKQLPKETKVRRQAASVVIPNWNGIALLENFLSSVIYALSDNPQNEIIVVDNASTDGSAEFVRTYFPGVRVLEMEQNLGFGGGSNAGVKAAVNDIVILLNNDMRTDPDFLAPLLEPFADPLVFAVSSQIFFSDPAKRREETGLTEIWWDNGILRASHRIDPEIRAAYPCAYPGGGSSAFDRTKFLELGGFDHIYAPFYYEDTDLGFLAWKRGWKVLYQPASVVHHHHRATVNKHFTANTIQKVLNKNQMLYCWKNIHTWRMLGQHLGVCFLDCTQRTARTPQQCGVEDVIHAFRQIRSVVKSRWLALSKAKITDEETFKQPLGGYFRDRFIAPTAPAPHRLKVLFVSPYPIEPPIHGGGVFMKQALTQLAKLADVHLVSFLDNETQRADQYPLHQVCKSAHFLTRGPVRKIPMTLTPFPVRQFADRDFAWLVHRTMLLQEIDIVQIEYTMLGQYAGCYSHIPCLLFEHDLFSETLRRGLQHGGMSWEALVEYVRMRLYEPRLLTQVTRVQVCSRTNAEHLKQWAPRIKKVDADMRAAIDVRYYSPGNQQRDLTTILFVGGFNHYPNVQGIQWFITEVLDHILAVRSDLVLEIVGSNPPAGPNIWDGHPNIRLTGQVQDIRWPLQRAGVFICPILTGSGVRVKLLEAFASEIPVVSTTIGAEGLASESGVVCELADTPEAFAASVLRLIENEAYRLELVKRARFLVERERDSRQAIALLEDAYRSEVSQVRPPATLAQPLSA